MDRPPLAVRALAAGLVGLSLFWIGVMAWILWPTPPQPGRDDGLAMLGAFMVAPAVLVLSLVAIVLALGLLARREWARRWTYGFGWGMAACGLVFVILAPITSGPPALIGYVANTKEVKQWFVPKRELPPW